MKRLWTRCLALVFVLALAACGDEHEGMVSTANPHASEAAAQMLRDGGSAVDAAIAAQMVLTLTRAAVLGHRWRAVPAALG